MLTFVTSSRSAGVHEAQLKSEKPSGSFSFLPKKKKKVVVWLLVDWLGLSSLKSNRPFWRYDLGKDK